MKSSIFFLFLFMLLRLWSDNIDGMEYEFIQQDTIYTFHGSFYAAADVERVLELIYDYDKIMEYSAGVKSLELLQAGEGWYEIAFTYQDLVIFENRSTWRRTLIKDENMITFTLLNNKNNIGIIPEMKSSSGYYRTTACNDSCRIEVFQECVLNAGFLKKQYFHKAEKEAVRFLKSFKEFIEKYN